MSERDERVHGQHFPREWQCLLVSVSAARGMAGGFFQRDAGSDRLNPCPAPFHEVVPTRIQTAIGWANYSTGERVAPLVLRRASRAWPEAIPPASVEEEDGAGRRSAALPDARPDSVRVPVVLPPPAKTGSGRTFPGRRRLRAASRHLRRTARAARVRAEERLPALGRKLAAGGEALRAAGVSLRGDLREKAARLGREARELAIRAGRASGTAARALGRAGRSVSTGAARDLPAGALSAPRRGLRIAAVLTLLAVPVVALLRSSGVAPPEPGEGTEPNAGAPEEARPAPALAAVTPLAAVGSEAAEPPSLVVPDLTLPPSLVGDRAGPSPSGRARVAVEQPGNFTRPESSTPLATVREGASLALGVSDGGWSEVTLEGWVATASLGPLAAGEFDALVSSDGGTELLHAAGGEVVADLLPGLYLERREEDGEWTRVRRTGRIRTATLR